MDIFRKPAITIIGFILILLVVFGIGYYVGISSDKAKESSYIDMTSNTFYATITSFNENQFQVTGLPVNDINYQGDFVFSTKDNTSITWRGTKIKRSDLKVGDHIAITYVGDIQETYPATIVEVTKIQLLSNR